MKNGMVSSINAKKNREIIEDYSKSLLSFGISFLDDCMFGIKKNDLITIGAESGLGKTEIATAIACHNAGNNKNVYFFALESSEREIERRISYKLATKKYFEDKYVDRFPVCYPEYEIDTIDKRFKPYALFGEQEAERLFSKNLFIVNRKISGYNADDFVEDFKTLDLDADLIIVDHINYFDSIARQSERENLKYAAKKINEMVNINQIPVIMIAHLNRPSRNDDRIIRDQDSVHGSSDICKESTKAIFLSKDFSSELAEENGEEKQEEKPTTLLPTLIYPAKSRPYGSINRYVGCIDYDITKNAYSENYIVGLLNYRKSKIKQYLQGENKPFWAKKGL